MRKRAQALTAYDQGVFYYKIKKYSQKSPVPSGVSTNRRKEYLFTKS